MPVTRQGQKGPVSRLSPWRWVSSGEGVKTTVNSITLTIVRIGVRARISFHKPLGTYGQCVPLVSWLHNLTPPTPHLDCFCLFMCPDAPGRVFPCCALCTWVPSLTLVSPPPLI
ncbi:unnamed protein product [Discosporangium mesarthrocarpum]